MKYVAPAAITVLMSCSVLAEQETSAVDEVRNSINNAVSGSDKLWSISAGTGFIDTSLTISGESMVTINTEPVLMGSISVNLFPETLKLELSYGATVGADSYVDTSTSGERRGGENANDVEYLNIFAKPFETRFGDFGYGYQKYKYNMLLINDWGNGSHIWDLATDQANGNSELILQVGDRYGAQTNYERISMVYNLPEFSWLLDGLGMSVAFESGNRIQLTAVNALAAKASYEGSRFGLGVYRTTDELLDGFSVKTFEIYNFDYNSDYFNLSTQATDKIQDGTIAGLNLEVAYKKTFSDTSIMLMMFGDFYEETFLDGRGFEVSTGGVSANMEWMF